MAKRDEAWRHPDRADRHFPLTGVVPINVTFVGRKRRVSISSFQLIEKLYAARGKPEIFSEFRKANAKKFRGFLAPEYNIRCIEAAVNMSFDEGMKRERQLFDEFRTGSQSAAQRHIFFAERQVNKIADIQPETGTLPVTRVGIIGAGTMGASRTGLQISTLFESPDMVGPCIVAGSCFGLSWKVWGKWRRNCANIKAYPATTSLLRLF